MKKRGNRRTAGRRKASSSGSAGGKRGRATKAKKAVRRVASKPRRRVRRLSRPTHPAVSVVIPARNESRTIGRVVRQARAVGPRTEVIVVVNGSADRTAARAARAGARVVRYKHRLGHDVGRAVGARLARGSVLLFADGDFAIPASTLRGFVRALRGGQDIVLNRYSGFADARRMHSTAEAKRLLNKVAGRPDLLGSSLTAVPHAMTKAAVERIGCEALAVPPLAQSRAIASGLSVTRGRLVEVARMNRRRGRRPGHDNVERLILGDHAEALADLAAMRGFRAGLTDLWRRREAIETVAREELPPLPPGMDPRVGVVIVARNEEAMIREVMHSAKRLAPEEIIVVVNGSTDRTADIVREEGVRLLEFPEALGHDVGRAIGALQARSEVLLFLDGDIVFEPEELWPFIAACRNGSHVALNDVNAFYQSVRMIDGVSMAKQYLNRMACTPHLGFGSLTAVPHAMTREAIERIGHAHLAVPPKAQAIAAVNGLTLSLVRGVDVFRTNRRRRFNAGGTDNLVEQMILGDHVEALQWMQEYFGPRVFFPDLMRRRDLC
ncbi:glycosyltransferase [Paenibacillus sp. TRM 82003]|nr:glycosyltransferase [Paenibacillus sp. TRM 82003]